MRKTCGWENLQEDKDQCEKVRHETWLWSLDVGLGCAYKAAGAWRSRPFQLSIIKHHIQCISYSSFIKLDNPFLHLIEPTYCNYNYY